MHRRRAHSVVVWIITVMLTLTAIGMYVKKQAIEGSSDVYRVGMDIGSDSASNLSRGENEVRRSVTPNSNGDHGVIVTMPRIEQSDICIVEVVDAETGAHLNAVLVYEADPADVSSSSHPGNLRSRETIADGDSPVSFGRKGQSAVWVKAFGYEWQHVSLDDRGSSKITVRLRPSGAICVRFDPPMHCREVFVNLTPSFLLGLGRAHAPVASKISGRHSLMGSDSSAVDFVFRGNLSDVWIHNLRPGAYSLVAMSAKPLLMAGRQLRVWAGETSFANLSLEVPAQDAPAQSVPLAGLIRLPFDWQEHPVSMELLYRGFEGGNHLALTHERFEVPVGGNSILRNWDAGEVLVGRWIALIQYGGLRMPYQVTIDVGLGGDRDVVIDLPPISEVFVRARHNRTGEYIGISGASCSYGQEQRTFYGVQGEVVENGVVFKAYVGSLALRVPELQRYDLIEYSHGFASDQVLVKGGADAGQEILFPVHEGRNEILLIVGGKKRQGIKVVLVIGDEEVEMSSAFWHRLFAMSVSDSDWSQERKIRSGTECVVFLHPPGTYVVRVPQVEGYQAVPDAWIDVPSEEIVDLVVPLRRR